MSVSEHAAATLVAAPGWIALSFAKKKKKKRTKKAIMDTLTMCKQLMFQIEEQVVTMWSNSKGRP